MEKRKTDDVGIPYVQNQTASMQNSAETVRESREAETSSEKDLLKGHRKRLRARVFANAAAACEQDLLELLLGYVYVRRDCSLLAKRLLQRFGDFHGIFSAKSEELAEVDGCGESVGVLLNLLKEILPRASRSSLGEKEPITLMEILAMGRDRLQFCAEEEVWAALLDKGNRLIIFKRIRQGNFNRVALEPRDVVECMLNSRAGSLVLMHNHPGGTYEPSPADRDLTVQIETALKCMGFLLQDHLIISASGCYSMKLERCLREFS